jgi:MoxR-like ATPase
LLADEINRSPAKTHAALLEIMQEFRVTIDGVSHPVPRPFLVMATQNPIESEGTYSLPEAQLDRFMFKAVVSYPDEHEEARILELHSQQIDLGSILKSQVQQVTTAETIQKMVQLNAQVRVEPKLLTYINRIVRATRNWPTFHMGASPRAGLAIVQGARTLAAFRGRDYAIPDDVVEIALPALRHIGIYGFRAAALREFVSWPACPLETTEQLEQLRWLWHGQTIAVHTTQESPHPGVDTPDDLERVRSLWATSRP